MGPRFVGATVWGMLAAVTVLHAQTAGPGADARGRAAEFLSRLQRAVDASDRRAVATLMAYPVTVLASGFNIPVKDSGALLRMYAAVFTPELRCAVSDAVVSTSGTASQRNLVTLVPDGLFIADQTIWAPFKNGHYLVARIRIPPPAPSVEGRKDVERVRFGPAKGERSAGFSGWLVRQNVDAFVVAAKKGETLQARIDGFRGHDATLRLSVLQTEPPARASRVPPDIGRSVSLVAAADGDYLVEVAHLARYCDAPQRYKLTITVR